MKSKKVILVIILVIALAYVGFRYFSKSNEVFRDMSKDEARPAQQTVESGAIMNLKDLENQELIDPNLKDPKKAELFKADEECKKYSDKDCPSECQVRAISPTAPNMGCFAPLPPAQ